MKAPERRPSSTSRPRAVVIGSYRDPLRLQSDELVRALGADADVRHVAASSPIRHSLRAFRQASRAIRDDGFELVHILDPRLAPVGRLLRRQFGVPLLVSISSADVGGRSPVMRTALRAAGGFDHAFTSEEPVMKIVRERAPQLPLSIVAPAASVLPWPTRRGLASLARALAGVRAGRLVIALPWPANRNDLRWFRDVVIPQLEAKPVCLLLGVPSRRQARLLVGSVGLHSDIRIHCGPLTGDVIASAARCVDAFVICASNELSTNAPDGQLAIALATGGVPVVTNAAEDARVLAHERNAFVVGPGDELGYVETLNQILSLPAIQRHVLGEEFARFTLNRWPWRDVADAYTERFAALVGRPRIPAELRAA